MTLSFKRYAIKNTTNGKKCRVSHYSLNNHISGKPCVTIHAADYGQDMWETVGQELDVVNNSDSMTDYFEHSRVYIYENNPYYAAARVRAELNAKHDANRYAKRQLTNKEAKTMNRQPKEMISKFPGKCDKCGRHVDAGETILWIARGKIECSHCIGTLKPREAPSDGQTDDQWAQALSWDTNQAPKTPKPTVAARACHNNVVIGGESIKPELVATSRVECTPESVDSDKLPELDACSRLVLDLMTSTVNAINSLDPDQRDILAAHTQWHAHNSDSQLRRYVWSHLTTATLY